MEGKSAREQSIFNFYRTFYIQTRFLKPDSTLSSLSSYWSYYPSLDS